MSALLFTACDPIHEDESAGANITADELTSSLQITAKSTGNNNLTVFTSPSRFIKVYDATTGNMVASGTNVSVQVAPPTTTATYYVTTINQDGTIVKSGEKSIEISEYTDLPEIYNSIFGDGNGGYTTTTWVWDTECADGVWGNGAYLENTAPGWWKVMSTDIDAQAEGQGTPKEGLSAEMYLSLSGCSSNYDMSGSISVNEEMVKAGWDIGTAVFSGMTPPMGISPNEGNIRVYDYHILNADGDHLYLCHPETGAGDWGTAFFWCFKKK